MNERPKDEEEPEPAVDGGTGPGVSPGDVETPGAATTPNEPDSRSREDPADTGGADRPNRSRP